MTPAQLLRTLIATSLLALPLAADGPVVPNPDYVVVASERCRATDGWSQVAGALAAKHACDLLVFENHPDELLEELRRRHPRIVGVVAMPDETGRSRMGEFHRLFRRLDDDPYSDVRWGVVTANHWPAAMEIVRATKPLAIGSMLSNTPVPLEVAEDSTYFDEGVAGRRVERTAGGAPTEILGDPVTADDFARAFDRLKPDLLVTSGRTNEERWMIGYTFDGGRVVVAEDGSLRARTPEGEEFPIEAEGPMAMLGAGSCLLGYVPRAGVLPMRFVDHAGARQIVGYCSTTWHGAGGWDLYRRFLDEPGRYTLAENTWLAQQDLVRRFHESFPGMPEVSTEGFDERAVPEFRAAVTERTGMTRLDDRFDDLAGFLWDRDALVLIGDPAWRVELDERPLPWTASVSREGTRLVIEASVHADLAEVATPAIVLEDRVVPGEILEGAFLDPVVLDDLVFLPGLGDLDVGATARLVVEAPLVETPPEPCTVDPAALDAALEPVPAADRDRLRLVIESAGGNGCELVEALRRVAPARRPSMVHLLANLPPRDRGDLPARFLLEQVDLAHESFERSPWREGVPEAVFLEAVLPYAHIDERRDDWRADFTRRFAGVARDAPSQEEAVRRLNETVFETFGIGFDPNKRLTNEQSPYQTIVQRCASCTGMSIMLANACRAAGIPARVAGIPEWPTGDNHTWIEVYDPADGRWHWIEAFGRGRYDEGWWVEKVRGIAQADHDDPRHRLWAAGWARPDGVPDRVPLWWLDEDDDPIPGVDRTAAYAVDRSRP